jgi:protease-4
MKRGDKVSWVWVLAGCVGLLVVAVLGLSAVSGSAGAGTSTGGPHVAVISLQGAITDAETRSLLGGRAGGARGFMEDLDKAVEDPSARAIVIRINSPGGAAAASQEMYHAVMRARGKKPIYCSMGDVAASGGYYIASACDKIYANPSSVTGSIGVITQLINYEGLFRKLGLDEATFKSGRFKDAGSPSRPLRPDERALFQRLVLDIYGQFVADIVAGRKEATKGKLTLARVKQLGDGRVYTGVQAKQNGLIDALGGLHDAVQEAGKAGGLTGKIETRDVGSGGGLGILFGASAQGLAEGAGRSLGAGFADEVASRLQSTTSAPALR